MKKFLIVLSFLLTGCLSTNYQSKGLSGGYTETWLSSDAVKVTFNANGYTGRQKAADYSLLRVAELAKLNGFDFFVLIDSSSDSTSYTTPVTYTANTYGSTTYISQSGGWRISKPRSENLAKLLKSKPENFAGIVYEAAFICRSISNKYDLNVRC